MQTCGRVSEEGKTSQTRDFGSEQGGFGPNMDNCEHCNATCITLLRNTPAPPPFLALKVECPRALRKPHGCYEEV